MYYFTSLYLLFLFYSSKTVKSKQLLSRLNTAIPLIHFTLYAIAEISQNQTFTYLVLAGM